MTELPMMLSSAKKCVFRESIVALVSGLWCLPLSEPLYFGYFLFFSPYIFKIMSFLAPLCVTTSLALVSLVLEPALVVFLAGECYGNNEGIELYNVLFGMPGDDDVLDKENRKTVDKFLIHGVKNTTTWEDAIFQEEDEFGEFKGGFHVDGQKVKPRCTVSNKVVIASEMQREESNAYAEVGIDRIALPRRQSSRKFNLSFDGIAIHERTAPRFGSFGSMRKDKEWTRTLACKLFEERHSDGVGEEGMDLLWERYEDDLRRRKERKTKGHTIPEVVKPAKTEELDKGEDEDGNGRQMCCLQALKFSSGKMNFRGSNMLRISRALTGTGWLHNLRRHNRV